MGPSQSKLAEALNALAAGGRVSITERREGISVYQLEGTEAASLIAPLEAAGWSDLNFHDAGGEISSREGVAAGGPGIWMTAVRPSLPPGVDAVVTIAGFEALLERAPISPVVWVEGLSVTIDTITVRYGPWWGEAPFVPEVEPNGLEKVVRVIGRKGPGSHIGRWLLRAPAADVSELAAKPWRTRAASSLLRAMAQEIEADERLLFKGPPPARFSVENEVELPADLFAALQSASRWMFENDRELENRHGLLAAEVARTSLRSGNALDLSYVMAAALEGARIAYNFGVTQQSRETLKALGDLRKAVSDDTAKLSETMRTLGAAMVAAVFANIGLIAARLTVPANSAFVGQAAICIYVVLAIYVLTVIGSGWHYIWIQSYLRDEWRNSLYRFLPNSDYDRLVREPVRRSELAFWWMAAASVLMMLILGAAVYYIMQT